MHARYQWRLLVFYLISTWIITESFYSHRRQGRTLPLPLRSLSTEAESPDSESAPPKFIPSAGFESKLTFCAERRCLLPSECVFMPP